VQRRPRSGRKHLTNITRIIRAEWIDWLSKGRRKAYAIKACNRAKPDFRLARGAQKNPPRSQLLGNSGSDRVDNLVKRLQDRVQPVTGEGCCMWDHDRDAALVELHSQGHSFAEIGQRLGVTRNAAISHFHWIRGTKRNAALMANAARWCDAVLADAGSEAGRAAARRHGVAFVSIKQLTRAIAGYAASGEPGVNLTDALELTENGSLKPLSERHGGRLLRFLEARGYIQRVGDLMQPVGLGELL
jgi:DNA-binding CsgD family transcriptional regulator